MRPSQYAQLPTSERPWTALATLLPYLWEFRGRVLIALGFLILAKLASIGIPLILKEIVDALDKPNALLALPIFFLIAYGALRLANALFGELRDAVFAKVTQRSIRRVALQVFQHLHKLALRFHLDRQTGGISRDIERGTAGIRFLLNFTVFSILPTLLEIGLVVGILLAKFDAWFAIITFLTLSIYILFTFLVTEWRMKFRRAMNEMDSKANTAAIDSLLNYETVKYFNNEDYEARRYDDSLRSWESAAIRTQTSLAALNTGQGAIIAIGVTLLMVLASQ
ncbi:MAG: ABC transporter transmembrane domain-containing protein, partial [Acidiferrobacterales bacterium]